MPFSQILPMAFSILFLLGVDNNVTMEPYRAYVNERRNEQQRSFPPMWLMMGIMGLGWGSIMGNPYIILAGAIPAERTGVYMGIFNMMICAPMLVFAGTMTFIYEPVLGGDPVRSGALPA